jgi:hypothetical protein
MFGPGDGLAILGMVLSLLMVLSIGGFILLFPVTKRLGGALDQWIRIKRSEGMSEDEVARFRADVEAFAQILENISVRLEQVEEQQQFVETLIEQKDSAALPSPGG